MIHQQLNISITPNVGAPTQQASEDNEILFSGGIGKHRGCQRGVSGWHLHMLRSIQFTKKLNC